MRFTLLLACTLALPALALPSLALADDVQPSTPTANPTTTPVPGTAYGSNESNGACKEDVEKLCPGVQPGGGRIIACLREHRDQVSDACKANLSHMQRHRRQSQTTGGNSSGGSSTGGAAGN